MLKKKKNLIRRNQTDISVDSKLLKNNRAVMSYFFPGDLNAAAGRGRKLTSRSVASCSCVSRWRWRVGVGG